MTWEQFTDVFKITFSKEVKTYETTFEIYCGKFKIKDVFSISNIYYEKLKLEDDFVDTKLLAHMFRGGRINDYLNVPVEIDINKEIKPIEK